MPGFWFYDAGRHGLTDVLMPDYFARVTMHGVRRGDIIDFRFGNLDPVEASYARLVVDNFLPPGPVTVAVVGRVGKPVPARKYADE